MADSNNNDQLVARPNAGRIAMAMVVLLAFVLAGVAAYVAWKFQVLIQPWMIIATAALAMIGFLCLFGWSTSLIGFKSGDTDRQFYDTLVDAISDASVVTDAKGRAIYANAPFLKLASKAGAARLVGFEVLYSGYTEFAEPIYQLAQAAREGKTLQRDVRVGAGSSAPGAAETPRWLRIVVSPLSSNSRGGKALWRLLDITDDRALQETAFSRLQFIISYLDQAPVGFFSVLPNGKVDYMNSTLAGWLGHDVVEAQGGNITLEKLLGENGALLIRAVAPEIGKHRIDRFSFPVAHKNGSAQLYDVMSRSDFDAEGKPLPVRIMMVRREDGASERNVGVSQFLAAVPIGIAEIDVAGVLKTANSAFLELSAKMKLGTNLLAALHKGENVEFASALHNASEQLGVISHFDCELAGDPPRSVQLTFTKLQDADQNVSVFAIDKTENKALEVQLAQSQKMQAIGELSAGIAHDFNNVLTPILGFADLLLTKMRPTDAAFSDVMNIRQNANRAASLVRQLLAFSRKQTMQLKATDLSEAMADMGNLLGRALSDRVSLKISHERDLGLVMIDFNQFEQVILNLAVNARDAMPKGGELNVRTYNLPKEQSQSTAYDLPEGDYVVCEVADNGTGIPQEILDKIWSPFFTTKEVGKGTGLGLSMVYGIVKQSGGFIYCDSVMGRGTTFHIYLPRYVPDEKAVEAAAIAAAVEAEAPKRQDFSGRGRILIVEDEDSVRAFAVRALTSRGYTVLEADSGEVALEVIEGDPDGFELILSDVVMPEMDGPTMLKELRARGIKTKIIFMSGYAEEAFEKNLEGPADFAFLQKPFSLKQLVEKVKQEMS
jgi:two-component system, cell cycle sensor histidine kinase and response regulator CckA